MSVFASLAPGLVFGNKALKAGQSAFNIFKAGKHAAERIESAKQKDEKIKQQNALAKQKELAAQEALKNKTTALANKNLAKSFEDYKAKQNFYKQNPVGSTSFGKAITNPVTPNNPFAVNPKLQNTLGKLQAKGIANQQKFNNISQNVMNKMQGVSVGQKVPKFNIPPSNDQIKQKALGKPKTNKIGPIALTYKQKQKEQNKVHDWFF